MKQLSSSELNNMSKEEMAAVILQMQQLHEQLSQQQKHMEQQIHRILRILFTAAVHDQSITYQRLHILTLPSVSVYRPNRTMSRA